MQPDIPPLPPLYGWFIPILVLLFLAMCGLSMIYNNYRKKKVIKQLERERFVRDGAMVICSNCGTETLIKCPDCGKQLFRTVPYCAMCGKPLER